MTPGQRGSTERLQTSQPEYGNRRKQEMNMNRKAEIAELRRKIAEKEQRIAELRREVAERRLAEWRRQVLAWAESPDRDLAEMPQAPAGLFPLAELTDAERQAREDLISEALDAAKKWGLK